MNDHNLDDLIIENIEPKNAKSKSILTIIALLIVVFIVGIILARLNLEEPNANNILTEENESEMISPELTLQSRAKEKEKKEEPKITDMIEEELNKPIQEAKLTVEKTEEVKKVKEVTKVEEVKEAVPVSEPVAVEESKKSEETPVEPEASSVPETEQNSEKDVAVPVPATVEKPKEVKAKKTRPKPVATGSYFIQVGSYRKTPSKRFLSVIKNNGFHYTITAPNAKGIKKLLIGPYPGRPAANAALTRVRDLVNKSAFVVKK